MTRVIADIMATELVTFSPETIIHKAIQVLLDETNTLVGVLSKKDCLRIVLSSSYHQDWGGTVAQYMSPEVVTVDAGTDLVSAAAYFLNSNFRRFPVLRDGQLVGQISRVDVLQALIEGA